MVFLYSQYLFSRNLTYFESVCLFSSCTVIAWRELLICIVKAVSLLFFDLVNRG